MRTAIVVCIANNTIHAYPTFLLNAFNQAAKYYIWHYSISTCGGSGIYKMYIIIAQGQFEIDIHHYGYC